MYKGTSTVVLSDKSKEAGNAINNPSYTFEDGVLFNKKKTALAIQIVAYIKM